MVMDSFDWHEAGLTVGQVAERSGAAPSALRFYERQGLISADRTTANQRRYRQTLGPELMLKSRARPHTCPGRLGHYSDRW